MTDLTPLQPLAEQVINRFTQAGLRVATAESCTGGLIAGLLTEVPGSSAVVDRGFVTYSNEAKTEMIGVPTDLIVQNGAVSRPVAIAMAEGAIASSHADACVSVTGIAGPGGGSLEKPVGLVHFAFARRGGLVTHVEQRFALKTRAQIRLAAVRFALEGLSNLID